MGWYNTHRGHGYRWDTEEGDGVGMGDDFHRTHTPESVGWGTLQVSGGPEVRPSFQRNPGTKSEFESPSPYLCDRGPTVEKRDPRVPRQTRKAEGVSFWGRGDGRT